jgi:hypothetical protein
VSSRLVHGCCCGVQYTCDDTCEFSSTYVLSGVTGEVTYEHRLPNALTNYDCPCPPPEDGANVLREYKVICTFTQIGTDVLTRCGSGVNCGYEARGVVDIDWRIELEEICTCCADNTQTVTSSVYEGTAADVPYCLTMVCVPAPPPDLCTKSFGGQAHWLISLQICDFAAVESHEFVQPNQLPQCSCSTSPYGIAIGGARFTRIARLRDPALINNIEWDVDADTTTAQRCVSPPIDSYDAASEACITCVDVRDEGFGPFALRQIEEFSPKDRPDPCGCLGPFEPFASAFGAFFRTGSPVTACASTVEPYAGPCTCPISDQWDATTAYNPASCNDGCQYEASLCSNWELDIA